MNATSPFCTTAIARPGTFHSSITSATRRSSSGMFAALDALRGADGDAIETVLDWTHVGGRRAGAFLSSRQVLANAPEHSRRINDHEVAQAPRPVGGRLDVDLVFRL